MQKHVTVIFVAATALFATFGCSAGEPLAPSEPSAPITTLEVYLARASLFETEFEQYRLVGSRLFCECGEIRNGRHRPQSQHVLELDSGLLGNLQTSAADFLAGTVDKDLDFSAPGQADGITDPGQLMLTLAQAERRVEVKTSVDATTNSNFGNGRRLGKLVAAVRGAVKGSAADGVISLCGNEEFYGLGS